MGNSVDVKLNKKDSERRDSILNKSLWKVLFAILVPIAMYNFLTFLFGVFDLKIVSMFPNDPKDSVAFFDEIKISAPPLLIFETICCASVLYECSLILATKLI